MKLPPLLTCNDCAKVLGPSSRSVCIVHVIVVSRSQACCTYFKKNSANSANPRQAVTGKCS